MNMLTIILAKTNKAAAAASTVVTADCDNPDLLNIIGIFRFALRVIQFVVPVLLILWGTIDLVKSVVAGKEEDIKKNQKALIKRVISAVIVFLLPIGVNILMGMIGATEWRNCWNGSSAKIELHADDLEMK